MTTNRYEKIVEKHQATETRTSNSLIAFLVGGTLGFLGNLLLEVYSYFFHLPTKTAGTYMLITFIFLA